MSDVNRPARTAGNELLLAIDTAGPRLQLALAGDAGCDTLVEPLARGHAEILFARIAALLARNSRGYADLTRIAVTTGPGSFTGLRIGLSAARGLGLARKLPVVGVPSLVAMGLAGPESGPFSIVVDARRGEAYVQQFAARGTPAGPPQLHPIDAARRGAGLAAPVMTPEAVDIARMARFALAADPGDFPPDPAYVRAADAKPQDGAGIARAEPAQ